MCNFILRILLVLTISTGAIAAQQDVKLSQQQLDEFFTNGIIVIPNFFTAKEVSQTLDHATRLQKAAEVLSKDQTGKLMYNGTQIVLQQVNDKNELMRIVWAGAAEPQLLQLSRQAKLLVPVGQILNSDKADQLNNQLHFRYLNGGVETILYQDIGKRMDFDPNWRDLNGRGSFVLCTIALDPMNEKVGTIYYIPKSHTRGNLMLGQYKDLAELKKVTHFEEAVPLTLHPGDLVMWHPYLIHGSIPNVFTTQRRIFINGFAYPGANTKPYPGEGSAKTIELH